MSPEQRIRDVQITHITTSNCVMFAVSGSWSLVNTTGALVKGGYGHTSVYDEQTGLILVHGGYHSTSVVTQLVTDALYEFNPNTSAWYVRSPFTYSRPVWAQECCRISPPRFLAECRKRRLKWGSFVLLLSAFIE